MSVIESWQNLFPNRLNQERVRAVQSEAMFSYQEGAIRHEKCGHVLYLRITLEAEIGRAEYVPDFRSEFEVEA